VVSNQGGDLHLIIRSRKEGAKEKLGESNWGGETVECRHDFLRKVTIKIPNWRERLR